MRSRNLFFTRLTYRTHSTRALLLLGGVVALDSLSYVVALSTCWLWVVAATRVHACVSEPPSQNAGGDHKVATTRRIASLCRLRSWS